MRTRVVAGLVFRVMFCVVFGVRSGALMRGAGVGGVRSVGSVLRGVGGAPGMGAVGAMRVASMVATAREGHRSDERAGRGCSS